MRAYRYRVVDVFTTIALEGNPLAVFTEDAGIAEDPATGSATGPLAAYMLRHGLAPRIDGSCIRSEQGVKMGRRSLLYALVHLDGDAVRIEVGGSVVPVAEATLTLPPSPR